MFKIKRMPHKNVLELEWPFTRFELPENVEVKEVDGVWMVYCKSAESARELRTQIIKSLELLNFYVDQIDYEGKINFFR
jgi:hypothetical protein